MFESSAIENRRSQRWGPILVGTDGSDGACRAIDAAAGLAADLCIQLLIVYVIDSGSDLATTRYARAEETLIGDVVETAASRILSEATIRARAEGAANVHSTLCSGPTAAALVAAARKAGAGAIFVGRRGVGGRLSQALMRSVSQKLAGISPVNLEIVP